ncbi:MAG: SDR family oxidoreductase, partial [Proteobacteria bacterium]|nr:SDR family oxidoreductase [Pseudomonadota bacterium]
MSNAFDTACEQLRRSPRRWAITGAAGFIGSHLIETLLGLGQTVVGLDNFSTGNEGNLHAVKELVGAEAWGRFTFIRGDIREPADCRALAQGADYILHQAALASVPRSIDDPLSCTQVNVDGFVNIVLAARDAKVPRIVYASSSSVYGDSAELPKIEDVLGAPLSPYALSKLINEQFASVFAKVYGLQFIGLRYFNIFGPRQSLDGPYAAVLPCWVRALMAGAACEVYGDGETSRDFCFVTNAVQANILGACTQNEGAFGKAFNIAVGERMTLNQLYRIISSELGAALGRNFPAQPQHRDFRPGDVRHSLASIERAQTLLGYSPQVHIREGITRYVSSLVAAKR